MKKWSILEGGKSYGGGGMINEKEEQPEQME